MGVVQLARLMLAGFDGDWSVYLLCPICRAPAGLPCWTRSGLVSGGRPDGVARTLARPHIARKRSARTGRGT